MHKEYFELRDLLVLVGVLASLPVFALAATLGEFRRLRRLARSANQG
jgi:hypothetical protein